MLSARSHAQAVICFPLEDIAKLNTYCEDLMSYVARECADTPTCMRIRIYNHYVYVIYISAYVI